MGNPKGYIYIYSKGKSERGLTKLNTIISIYFKACSMIQLNLWSQFQIKLLEALIELVQAQTEQMKNEYLFVSHQRI